MIGGDAFEQLRAFFDRRRGTNDRKLLRAAATARSASGIPASRLMADDLVRELGLIEVDGVVGPNFLAVDHERIFLAERLRALPRARSRIFSWLC